MTARLAIPRLMTRALPSFLLVVSATALSAQSYGGAWEGYRHIHHRNDCRLAHQVLTHGQPAEKRDWALRVIVSCGPLGGEAIASLLYEYADATDRTEDHDRIVLLGTELTDRSIYEAAMTLAANSGASEVSRVQAIRAVYYQLRPGSFADYESFIGPDIIPFAAGTSHSIKGDPLPEDADARALAAMEAIRLDPGVPEIVKTAASKTRGLAASKINYEELCSEVSLEECMRRLGVLPPDP